MIAAVSSPNPIMPPCPIRWVGRKGLSVQAVTYCNQTRSVADGVVQIPEEAKICENCKKAIASVPR